MILVDSNIILDILTRDIKWYEWSAQSLAEAAEKNELIHERRKREPRKRENDRFR